MAPALSGNAVRDMVLMTDKPKDNSVRPVVQVINLKALANNRIRAVLSDGTHFVQGMFASQVVTAGIAQNCILQLDDYMTNRVGDRSVIILLSVTVLHGPVSRIGAPADIEKAGILPAKTNGTAPLHNSTNSVATAVVSDENKNNPYGGRSPPAPASAPIVRSNPNSAAAGASTPIASLNLYNGRWTITARLTEKSAIRTWSNAKGEGSLFSVCLLDASGDIRATFFKEAVDQFYNMLQVGSVYSWSGGRLKLADMKWNTCSSPHEITFDTNSDIRLQNDTGEIGMAQYNLVKLAAVEQAEANSLVDVIGIVKSVSDVMNLISKKSGKELTKVDVTLVDDSGVELGVTLWGEEATKAPTQLAGQPVAAFRRARVSDYNGKSLSAGSSIDVAPPLPETSFLQQWWQRDGGKTARSLTTRSGGAVGTFEERRTIASIADDNLGHGEKPDWITVKATVTFLKNDKDGGAWYPACTTAGEPCKNRFKVTQTTDGSWFCDRCGNSFPEPLRRWIFSGVIEDGSGSTWISFFNEQAETLLESTADEVYKLANNAELGTFDSDAYDSVFAKAVFREYIFKLKVKAEFHDGDNRVKTTVYSMHPVDYVKESNDLLTAIELF